MLLENALCPAMGHLRVVGDIQGVFEDFSTNFTAAFIKSVAAKAAAKSAML